MNKKERWVKIGREKEEGREREEEGEKKPWYLYIPLSSEDVTKSGNHLLSHLAS